MAIQDINLVYRQVKGSKLSNEEADGNFGQVYDGLVYLDGQLVSLAALLDGRIETLEERVETLENTPPPPAFDHKFYQDVDAQNHVIDNVLAMLVGGTSYGDGAISFGGIEVGAIGVFQGNNKVIDWGNYIGLLPDVQFNWRTGDVFEGVLGSFSANFKRREFGSYNGTTLNYDSCELFGTQNRRSIDWQNRELYSVATGLPEKSINYELRNLCDWQGRTSINYDYGLLYNSSTGETSVQYSMRELYASNEELTVDWQDKFLAHQNKKRIGWAEAILYDNNEAEVLYWDYFNGSIHSRRSIEIENSTMQATTAVLSDRDVTFDDPFNNNNYSIYDYEKIEIGNSAGILLMGLGAIDMSDTNNQRIARIDLLTGKIYGSQGSESIDFELKKLLNNGVELLKWNGNMLDFHNAGGYDVGATVEYLPVMVNGTVRLIECKEAIIPS